MESHLTDTLVNYPASEIEHDGSVYSLVKEQGTENKFLGVRGNSAGFEGGMDAAEDFSLFPLSAANARELRAHLSWLNPVPLGVATSMGFGDRLGVATPGHVASMGDSGVMPIFAQQSVRENDRTGRTPQQVIDDAMWGVFQMGWQAAWGADADHIKEVTSLPAFLEAGYTFFTIDPGDHVDNAAHTAAVAVLREKVAALPWEQLDSSPEELYKHYLDHDFNLDGITINFSEVDLLRAAAKYGRSIAHAKNVFEHIQAGSKDGGFDLEMSVDETDTPTSPEEHFFIAGELKRLGIPVNSLAPRFIGSFEKGVDYIGDLQAFEQDVAGHAAVMKHYGSYKLSVHTGSDKFSIYPLVAEYTGGRVHVKTAGTSYLEALRVAAAIDPAFFREILNFSRGRYNTDRATYHVSGNVERVPAADALRDADLLVLFEQFDARQVLHVTFGSVLDEYGERLMTLLRQHEAAYAEGLKSHFEKHIKPFARV
ncbi:MAG: hypothetical protein JXB38_01890 [Anaerolineales bacterium]|nr:hypothetical protein [Anaerolineales bacterium]